MKFEPYLAESEKLSQLSPRMLQGVFITNQKRYLVVD